MAPTRSARAKEDLMKMDSPIRSPSPIPDDGGDDAWKPSEEEEKATTGRSNGGGDDGEGEGGGGSARERRARRDMDQEQRQQTPRRQTTTTTTTPGERRGGAGSRAGDGSHHEGGAGGGGRGGGGRSGGGRGGGRGGRHRDEARREPYGGGGNRGGWGQPPSGGSERGRDRDYWGGPPPMRDDRRAPPPPGGDWDRRDDGWGGPPPMRDSRDHWGPPPPRGPPGGGWDRRDGWGAPPPRGARDDYGPPPGYYDDRYDSRGPPPPRDYYDDRDRGYYRSPPRGPPPRDYYDDRRDSWGGRSGYDPRGPPPDRDGPPPRDDGRPYVIDTNGNNGLIVGPKGSNVRRIETETGARVNCVSDKTTVEVTGHPEAVRRAVDMIRDILAERSDRGDDLRSRLGGKRGRDDDRRDDRDKRPRIDSLLEHLRTQAKEAGLSLDFQPESIDEPADENGDVTKSIGIENYIGLVIGRQGRMQSEIQSVTGIPMDINRDDNTASFKGPADKVAQGIALVREVIETTIALRDAKRDSAPAVRDSAPQYERKTGPREGDVEDTVDISGFVGAVLGKGGAQVKYIKSQVRCHLTVNREKEIVELRGPPEKVELGVKLINQTIERTKERNSKKEQRESVEEAEPQAAAEEDDDDEIEEGSIHEEETA